MGTEPKQAVTTRDRRGSSPVLVSSAVVVVLVLSHMVTAVLGARVARSADLRLVRATVQNAEVALSVCRAVEADLRERLRQMPDPPKVVDEVVTDGDR